jgi:hypothetical protein
VLLAFLHLWSQVAYVAGYFFERLRRGWKVGVGEEPITAPAVVSLPRRSRKAS